MAALTLGVFGDAGNSYYNANSFYYKPGFYSQPAQGFKSLFSTGGTEPVQAAVADMVRSWGVNDLIQLGDTSYNAQSSTLLDYQIGKFYNDYMQPYGNKPDIFAFSDPKSIYSTGQGGVLATPGKRQWPYNLYDFPNGFANPATGGPGGSGDGLNHFWAVQGNHDYGTIIGSYNDFNVNQLNFRNKDIGTPAGPDAYDFKNNISATPPNTLPFKDSAQQLLDYLPYLKTADAANPPSYLKPGQVQIGSNDADGYEGIYYSVDLGQVNIGGINRPLLHVVNLDTPRIYVDAGYYDFQGVKKADMAKFMTNNGYPATASNFDFDPTSPDDIALFNNSDQLDAYQNPAIDPKTLTVGPSASYRMFQWAKQDLKQSNAIWKVVTGHHTAYHGGAIGEDANSNNFSNPIIIKLLAALKDENNQPLLDAYWNGHSHAYSRVLEMGDDKNGIGVGIPLITTGNGGKDEDYLNLVPYGSNVLIPQNWTNVVYKTDGDATTTAEINGLSSGYLAAFPQGANPTSVGTSGPYRYLHNDDAIDPKKWPEEINLPSGYNLADLGKDPDSRFSRTITAIARNPSANDHEFTLQIPQYNSILSKPSQNSAWNNDDVSGLYGFGSGAMYVEADEGYMWMNYRTTAPLDPAVTLIGSQLGLAPEQWQRGSLFYEQWSPVDATIDNLALFSFDIIIDDNHPEGFLDHLQLVQNGNGYMETALGSTGYQDVTFTFELQGNNPVNPQPADRPDPSRAAVDLHFSGGQLIDVTFAKDPQGNLRQGTGYKELANSINGNNKNLSSTRSALVGININLEAQYYLADQSPDASLYQDWYMLADTDIQPTASTDGSLVLNLQPKAQRAREILATQPITTGYNKIGPQNVYSTPQRGLLTVKDALNTVIAGGNRSVALNSGQTSLKFTALPAPGPLSVSFDGDPYSSYQVNFKAADTVLNVSYGDWSTGLSSDKAGMLTFSKDLALNVSRSDGFSGRVSFGLQKSGSSNPTFLLRDADPSEDAALNTARIFKASGDNSWLQSEGRRLGSSAAFGSVSAGDWVPVAVNAAGQSLAVQSIISAGNTAEVTFAGGIQARYSAPGTGTASSLPNGGQPQLILQRLGRLDNGLAFYEADPLTGAITSATGGLLLPGQAGYLQQALSNATKAGLRLNPGDLPAYQSEKVYNSLPILADKNYGLLLIRGNNPNDLASSYSQANVNNQVVVQSFATPGRGICFGIEDLVGANADNDFNDIIGRISGPSFAVI